VSVNVAPALPAAPLLQLVVSSIVQSASLSIDV